MNTIDVFAGAYAINKIKAEGFSAQMFDTFLGASGGPKWFVLAGLDRVIFPELFSQIDTSINVVGSSAGAFRAACLTQKDPIAAINRLADKYSNTVYSAKPTVAEITEKGYDLLEYVMGATGVHEVLNHPKHIAHFSVAQCHGAVESENKFKQMSGLLKAGARNAISRKRLAKSFTRALFSAKHNTLSFIDPDQFPTNNYLLTQDNLIPALMASGSIPLVLEGVANIPGAKPGMYRDGGIIDYHFDLRFNTDKLVLYPHFYSTPTPGWFDKNLKRPCTHSSYENVVLISPSKAFVETLPYKKIPDRKDFEKMEASQRIDYWSKVISESDRMGEELINKINDGSIVQHIKPIQLNRK